MVKNCTSIANKAENRKVVIYYLEEKTWLKENAILGIKEEPKPVVKPAGPIVYPSKVMVRKLMEKKKRLY